MNKWNYPVLVLFAVVASASAHAAEAGGGCKLRGGSIVPLAAEACAKEGGTLLTGKGGAPEAKGAGAASAPATAPAPAQLSADPRLAAAQKTILELLNKPVAGEAKHRKEPEGIVRRAQFAECKLQVEETVRLDYGNVLSARKVFRISAAADFRALARDAFGTFGALASRGGEFKAQAVYLEQPHKGGGDALSVSVEMLDDDQFRKFTMPGEAPYWEGASDDLWLADEYGYARRHSTGNLATGTVRMLFIVRTAEDAAALKQAFDALSAVCRP